MKTVTVVAPAKQSNKQVSQNKKITEGTITPSDAPTTISALVSTKDKNLILEELLVNFATGYNPFPHLKDTYLLISGYKARYILDVLNPRNRKKDTKKISIFKETIANDSWQSANGETIKFDEHGALADGQNRLAAIDELDHPGIICKIVFGVKEEVKDTIDTGKSKTHANVVQMNGYTEKSSELSGAILSLYSMAKNTLFHNQTIPMYVVSQILADNPELVTVFKKVVNVYNNTDVVAKIKGRVSLASVIVIYFCVYKLAPELADEFLTTVFTGWNANPKHKFLHFVNMIKNNKGSQKTRKDSIVILGLHAFNQLLQGKDNTKLVWGVGNKTGKVKNNEKKTDIYVNPIPENLRGKLNTITVRD